MEEAELAEFELLEEVAQESSFSSQCSLVLRMVGNTVGNTGTHLASSPKAVSNEERDKKFLSFSPVSQQHVDHSDGAMSHSDAHMGHSDSAMSHSDVGKMKMYPQSIFGEQEVCPQSGVVPPRGPLTSVSEDSEEDLDSNPDYTLAREQGSDFDDHEVWDSFISGTPNRQVPSSNDDTPVASPQVYTLVNSQPVGYVGSSGGTIVHQLHHQQSPVSSNQKHPGAVRKVRVIPDHKGQLASSPSHCTSSSDMRPTSSSGYSTTLPPPSALVAKLFPSLQKEKTVHKTTVVDSQQQPCRQVTTDTCTCAHNEAAPRPPTKQGDPATYLDGLDEQVRVKLVQLEGEIERFKAENVKLEKLRNEREEVS